ncbi:site-2 protease family protein [Olsenella sp. HMSC062G07]|uniref:site-2 protease family protein n=1 Tax=Olsenella sp. HMSC062G07 TaxID=1739330 RepID=UPI0008A318DA|nr:site-2 protease family protein [Olsenella sp. HMSC062G07]
MNISTVRIVTMVFSIVLVIFSTILHEVAHGWMALTCGDTTARDAGRLSLDPRRHLDPFGSFVLPLIMAWLGGPVFAYAKPVPYDPRNLRNRRVQEFLVALAGPLCNVVQALAGTLLFVIAFRVWDGGMGALFWVLRVLSTYVYVNLVLAFFNLIPLPPLDGSKVVSLFLKGSRLDSYYAWQRYSMPILLVILFVLPMVLHVDILGAYLNATAGALTDLLLGLGA